MKIKFPCKVNKGKGLAISIISKKFKLSFGFAKADIKPVFCYKYYGYDKVLKVHTVLRHINILRFKNFAVGFSLSIPFNR